eukprot:m.474326 g.474326  ORF g.474326 m.474326 type:complete len:439 (+) comp36040_c0_seq1:87-1403(+)
MSSRSPRTFTGIARPVVLTAGVGLLLATSTLAQSVAFFSNPVYGDPAEDGLTRSALTTGGVTLSVFSSVTSPAAWSSPVTVVPEQERRSLLTDMPSTVTAALRTTVSNGGRLVAVHAGFPQGPHFCNRIGEPVTTLCNEVTWVNTVFGLNLEPCDPPQTAQQWALNPAFRGTRSAFAAGPAFLTDSSNILGIKASTLPLGASAVYSADNCAVGAVIPFGRGEIVTVGFDWFSNVPVWSNFLVLAASGATVLPLSSVQTTTTSPTPQVSGRPSSESFTRAPVTTQPTAPTVPSQETTTSPPTNSDAVSTDPDRRPIMVDAIIVTVAIVALFVALAVWAQRKTRSPDAINEKIERPEVDGVLVAVDGRDCANHPPHYQRPPTPQRGPTPPVRRIRSPADPAQYAELNLATRDSQGYDTMQNGEGFYREQPTYDNPAPPPY